MPVGLRDIENLPLMQNGYVRKIVGLATDKTFYDKSPSSLEQLRLSLFRESLSYFSSQNENFAQALENLGIDPKNAQREDLVDLAQTSDNFRGDGQKKYMVKDVPEVGYTFRSSGTTGKGPVTIYRSPIDMYVGVHVDRNHAEYMLGSSTGNGLALMMAAPELRDKMAFVGIITDSFEASGSEVKYGMKVENVPGKTIWEKLRPDKENISAFYKSKKEPKFLLSAPVGIYRMLDQFDNASFFMKHIVYKRILKVPPVRLGRGGAIFTGGGIKGTNIPPMEKLMEMAKKKIVAEDVDGKEIPAPWIDALSHTENLGVMFCKPNTLTFVPNPLSEVFLVDQKTFKPIKGDGEGVLGIFNSFTTTYFEGFFPGDLMERIPDDGYYGSAFKFKRRLTKEEGFDLNRMCGGAFEEMMKE